MLSGFQVRSNLVSSAQQEYFTKLNIKTLHRQQKKTLSLSKNSTLRRSQWLDHVAHSHQFQEQYMNGSVKNDHPTHLHPRDRNMHDEIHEGDGIYTRKYETTKQRSINAQVNHKEAFLGQLAFNDRDEPRKKFKEFLRKREHQEEIHSSRMKLTKSNNEAERVQTQINRSPVEFDPLNTEILVYPGYRQSQKDKWMHKNDFNTYQDMQQWKIWKELSVDRNIPLSQSIDNTEPFVKKITEINRDIRNKSLEKSPKEFNAVFRRDPMKEKTILQTNSLRSYGSIKGLLNLVSPKQTYFNQQSINNNNPNQTRTSFFTKITNEEEQSSVTFSPKDTMRQTINTKDQRKSRNLSNKVIMLTQNDLRSYDTIKQIMELKELNVSTTLMLKQESSTQLSLNKQYQESTEELNDSHILSSLTKNTSAGKSYYKSAQDVVRKTPFKMKNEIFKQKLQNLSSLDKNQRSAYSNLNEQNQKFQTIAREKNVKSAIDSMCGIQNYGQNRRKSFSRIDLTKGTIQEEEIETQRHSPRISIKDQYESQENTQRMGAMNNSRYTNTAKPNVQQIYLSGRSNGNSVKQRDGKHKSIFSSSNNNHQSAVFPQIKKDDNSSPNKNSKKIIKKVIEAYFTTKITADTANSRLDISKSINKGRLDNSQTDMKLQLQGV